MELVKTNSKIVLITAFTPTKEQINQLSLTIDSYKNFGLEVMVCSHTILPKSIQKKIDYFFYDKKNKIDQNFDLISYLNYETQNWRIESKLFQKNFYGFAIMRLISNGIMILKNLGYEKTIVTEYDCQILDSEILKVILEKLENHDHVFFNENGDENENIIGSLIGVNINKIPKEYIEYNEYYLYDRIKNSFTKSLEEFTKNTLSKNNNVIFMKSKDFQKNIQFGKRFESRLNNFTLYHENGRAKILYYSYSNKVINIDILVNDSKLINFKTHKNFYYLRDLCEINNLKKIKIFSNDNFLYEEIFDEKKHKNIIDYTKIIIKN